jgi:hypothetical protein
MLKSLPETRKTNPKVFFRITKACCKLAKKAAIVKGMISSTGEEIELQQGLKEIITGLYCPKKRRTDFVVVKCIKNMKALFKLNTAECSQAVKELSYDKAKGVDLLSDKVFHDIKTEH